MNDRWLESTEKSRNMIKIRIKRVYNCRNASDIDKDDYQLV